MIKLKRKKLPTLFLITNSPLVVDSPFILESLLVVDPSLDLDSISLYCTRTAAHLHAVLPDSKSWPQLFPELCDDTTLPSHQVYFQDDLLL